MFGIGAGEWVLILIVGLIVFGPGHLPEVGRAIGKGLKEFRKAQAALSATLEEVSAEPQKKSSTENSSQQSNVSSQQTEVSSQTAEKKSDDLSANTEPRMTADDVINLAKENPIPKENMHEKIFNSSADNSTAADSGASNVDSRSNSDSTGKKSEPSTN